MRIMTHYSYRGYQNNYSISLETLRDIPTEEVPGCVDNLFEQAQAAIKRQIEKSKDHDLNALSKEDDSSGPENGNNNNGNGREKKRKYVLKDPDAPITPKQRFFIIKLAKSKNRFINNLEELNMQKASELIAELRAV